MPENRRINVILLPGLDGTGTLFEPMLKAAPGWASPVVVSCNHLNVANYQELADAVFERIDQSQPFLLLDESFSGPIAAKKPKNLLGVIMCASFVVNPRPLLSRIFVPALLNVLVRLRPPRWIMRHLLTGQESSGEMNDQVASAIATCSPKLLTERIGMVIEIDASNELEACTMPMLYIAPTQDKLVPRSALATMRTVKPDISFTQIDGSHSILQSHPQEAWAAIGRLFHPKRTNHENN